jgi:hypothetical protein
VEPCSIYKYISFVFNLVHEATGLLVCVQLYEADKVSCGLLSLAMADDENYGSCPWMV